MGALKRYYRLEEKTLMQEGNPIGIYGAGQLARSIKSSFTSVKAFIEDGATGEKIVDGIPVLSPLQFKDKFQNIGGDVFVCICLPLHCTYAITEKAKSLLGEHFSIYTFTELMNRDHPIFENGYLFWSRKFRSNNYDKEYKKIINSMDDAIGKEHLLYFIDTQKNGINGASKYCERAHDFITNSRDIEYLHYIDCGAYDGDTIVSFIARIGVQVSKITAVEPDLLNVDKMLRNFANNNLSHKEIDIINAAITSKNGLARFNTCGDMSSSLSTDGDVMVQTYQLSNFINDDNLFIKLDIEGNELEAIKTSISAIKKHKPIMAISIYHKPFDLLTIFDILSVAAPQYRVNFRVHGMNATDSILYFY